MTKPRRSAAGALLTLTLAACGGGGGGTVALPELGARLADAECAYEVRCGFFPDQATCVAATPSNLAQVTADVRTGKTIYDGAAASDCLALIANLSCQASVTSDLESQRCLDAFKGTVAAGGACFSNEECVSERCSLGACDVGTACCAGACAAAFPPIARGAACQIAQPGSACVKGTSCQIDAAGVSATCQPLVALGAPCSNFGDCVAGAECQQDGTGGGTCARFPTTGHACDLNRLPCDDANEACDAATGLCAPRVSVGGACQTTDACALFAGCDAATLKCVAKNGVGGACLTQDDCLGQLSCSNGACAIAPVAAVCS